MPKLNPIPPKKMVKMLLKLGFIEERIRGSHHFYFNKSTRETTTIPIHGNEQLSVGILKDILEDIGLSVAEYEKLRLKM